jgi:hypothetical protein
MFPAASPPEFQLSGRGLRINIISPNLEGRAQTGYAATTK